MKAEGEGGLVMENTNTKTLVTPLSEADVRSLRVGDVVYLSGTIYTARDMAHEAIRRCRREDKALPVDFEGSAIFHAGPVVEKCGDGWNLVVIGPTTSIRMEPYAEMTASLGARVLVGKGGLADDSRRAFAEHGQVYLQAAPGCAVVLAEGIQEVEGVHWLELGVPEALWILKAKKFGPLVVAMDSTGRSLYAELRAHAHGVIDSLYP